MFIDLLQKRRSFRTFEDKPVSSAHRDIIIEAALRSPSSKGANPWHFIVVEDKDRLALLSKAKPRGAAFSQTRQRPGALTLKPICVRKHLLPVTPPLQDRC